MQIKIDLLQTKYSAVA